MTAIAIVEPHRMTRIGIERAAMAETVRVVAAVATVAELGDARPDVIVLSSRACAAATNPIQTLRARAHVLLMVDASASVELLGSVRAGVRGIVSSDVEDAELATAISAVAAGAFYLMGGVAERFGSTRPGRDHLDANQGKDGAALLGSREVQTLRLLASGYTHGQIGRRMGLTELTVNTYVKRIRAKLNAGNKAELTRKAIALGYLATEPTGPADGAEIEMLTATLASIA